MTVLLVIAAWIMLSLPLSLLIGAVIRYGSGEERE